MEGRGVTNYASGTPAYAFSAETTEFDDALISKGIVSFEQAMIAKGASPKEARRLAEINQVGATDIQSGMNLSQDEYDGQNIQQLGDGHDDESDGTNENDEDEDDESFLKQYRHMRIDEIKNGRRQEYGDVIPIARPDWNREVNEASKSGLWVVVGLTRSSTSLSHAHDAICDKVEEITKDLADKFVNVKFVSIPSTSAIENWQPENLPTLFCYRFGKMQHQLVGIDAMGGAGVNTGRLEWRLAILGVVQTELEEDPTPSRTENVIPRGGVLSSLNRLATSRDSNRDDYDDVD